MQGSADVNPNFAYVGAHEYTSFLDFFLYLETEKESHLFWE
jgi:hypothetical protein